MIKTVLFDMGDLIFVSGWRYKQFSPIFMKTGIEPFFMHASMVFHKIRKSIYDKEGTPLIKLKRKLFPGVKHTFKQLKRRKLKLAILTDTMLSKNMIVHMIKHVGLYDHIDEIICSSDIGAIKPSRRAYQCAAVEIMKSKMNETVFVGHAEDELDGAKRCGITTIGYRLDPGAKADYVANKFSDILKIIDEINSKKKRKKRR